LYEVLAAEIVRLVTACKGFFEISAAEAPGRIGDGNLFLVMVQIFIDLGCKCGSKWKKH